MPEHLKALIYILIIATSVYVVAKKAACATAIAPADFVRRRNLWYALTLIAFLAHNVWICLAAAGLVLLGAQGRERNRFAMFVFLIFALPPITRQLQFGVPLFDLDYVRLLILTVLVPEYLRLRREPDTVPFGRLAADKWLAAGMVLNILLLFEHRTFTSILRDGFFYAFVDIFLPYYVSSRALRNVGQYRDALMSLVVAGMVLSVTLFVEFLHSWLLYQALDRALGYSIIGVEYLVRDGHLRASATVGHAIPAGYCVAVCFGIYLGLRRSMPSAFYWNLGLFVLFLGFVGPLSRGPWVGAVAMLLVFVAFGRLGITNLTKLGLAGLAGFAVLMLTPYGPKLIDYLPFIGSVDSGNVVGRQILAEVSYQLFWENPIFGRYDFVETPAMQALRGSDGMVDLVNTYAIVALGKGAVGLFLFVAFFISALIATFSAMRRAESGDPERHDLGRAFLGCLVGILIIIATVSPILLIPTLYWIVAGLGVGYASLVQRAGREAPTRQMPPAGGARRERAFGARA